MAGRTGWLFLESRGKVNAFTEHYFVLDEGYLRYFAKEEDLDPLAVVNVAGCEATSVGKARMQYYAFRINVTRQQDGRYKYVIGSDSEEEARNWLKALVEHGVSANIGQIKLTAKKAPSGRSGKSMSSKSAASTKSTASTKQRGGRGSILGFLGLGGKSMKSNKSLIGSNKSLLGPASTGVEEGSQKRGVDEDEVEVTLEDVPAPPPSAEALEEEETGPRISLREAPESPFEPGHSMRSERMEGLMIIPTSSLKEMAENGGVDGDKPFHEVMNTMGRQSFARQASQSVSKRNLLGGTSAAYGVHLSDTSRHMPTRRSSSASASSPSPITSGPLAGSDPGPRSSPRSGDGCRRS